MRKTQFRASETMLNFLASNQLFRKNRNFLAMTPAVYLIMYSGIDNGDDLSEELLRDIYNRIKTDELITMEDHVTPILQVFLIFYKYIKVQVQVHKA